MKDKTAVEWLVEQIRNNKFVKASEQIEVIKQAKEMEKEQIIDAHENGFMCPPIDYGLDYYNKTYKK